VWEHKLRGCMDTGFWESDVGHWLRWVSIPFATIVGSFIGTFLVGLLLWFVLKIQGSNLDGWYFLYIMPVISSGIFGFLFAYIPYVVAPRGKLVVGTVMVTLLAVVNALGLLLIWKYPDSSVGYSIQETIGGVVTVVAAVFTLFAQENE